MANGPGNVLSAAGHIVPDFDFEAPLAALSDKACDHFRDASVAAGLAAKQAGNEAETLVYDSLRVICGFMTNYHDKAEPYRPIGINGDKRTAIPADLTPDDLTLIADLHARAKDPALRARLGDLLWLRRRDHKAALAAVGDYVAAANRLLTPSGWFYSRELFRRALQLADALGRKNDAFTTASDALLAVLDHPLVKTEKWFACHLLKVAIGLGVGDTGAMAQIAHDHAELATINKEFRLSREYRQLEADFAHFAKQTDVEAKARLLIAETYVGEGEAALLRVEPSHYVAAKFLLKAVEALRQAKGDPARIAALREKIAEYQVKSMDEMQPFEFEIDLTESAESAMELVRVPDLQDAIEIFALAHSIISVKALREEVIKNAQEAPLSHLSGADIVNNLGQIQKSTGPLIGATGEDAEKEMEARMFQTAARSTWLVRAQGYIQPARMQIWGDHAITPPDLAYIVQHNPFIPAGHQGIFMRGLFYGFAGDFLLASHLLTPQIENSIRYILTSNGVDVSNLNSDLTQPVKLLGPLMALPEMKTIFGEDLMFEIRGLLIEKTGYSFRNNLAHGFVTEHESYSHAAINIWWLVLRLCLMSMKILEDRRKAGVE
jgi:hypothetical protein